MHLTNVPPDWQAVLPATLTQPHYSELEVAVNQEQQNNTVFPPDHLIFKAFSLCPFAQVKVVILGQDPYHGPNQATGLAFSVPEGEPTPPSLRNIYQEIAADTGTPVPTSGNLTQWAEQGVLLLNTTLTVRQSDPGSHRGLGWEEFTDNVIMTISQHKQHVAFLLWGSHARSKRCLLDEQHHLILEAPHPSPLSAYRGFFGCRHFSKTNDFLQAHNQEPIDWAITPSRHN